jgi:hypothetical protein
MASVFLPNLMFEEELNSSVSFSAGALRRIADLAPLMGLLADSPDDCVLVGKDQVPRDLPDCLADVSFRTIDQLRQDCLQGAVFHPWGWSSAAARLADQLKIDCHRPSLEAVRMVNSRRFLEDFDRILPVDENGRPASAVAELAKFSSVCSTIETVQTAIDSLSAGGSHEWVIKAEFSQAARNRLHGRGPALSTQQTSWIRKRLVSGEVVAVEPWVRRVADAGLQFEIQPRVPATANNSEPKSRASGILFNGVTELVNDVSGRYRGTAVSAISSHSWQPAVKLGAQIASAAQTAGYHGFLGIDTMMFVSPLGQHFIRLANDLNGRCTMGRLALSIQKRLPSSTCTFWCHVPAEFLTGDRFSFAGKLPESVSTIRTSPGRIGSRATEMTSALLSAGDPEDLKSAIRTVIEHTNIGHNV